MRSAVEDAASQCRYEALCYSERSHRTGAAKARGILPAEIFCTFPLESLHKMRFGTAKEETEAALPTGTSVGSKISGDAADASPEKARPFSGRRVQILRCRDCGMTSYQYLDESGRWVRGTEDGPCGHSHRFTVEEELEDKTVQVLRCRNCGGISIGWM